MSLIVRVDYNIAKQYKNKSVSTTLDGKKHNVYFKVVCDDFTVADCVELAKNSGNIIMLDYQGLETNIDTKGVYVGKSYECGLDVNETDIENILASTPNGVTPIIKLPEGFTNIETIWRLCGKYKNIRFCGGSLFCADGCRIGCCGLDVLDKKGIKHTKDEYFKVGCCCGFPVVDYEGLKLDIGATKTATVQAKKPKLMFGDLLYKHGKVPL